MQTDSLIIKMLGYSDSNPAIRGINCQMQILDILFDDVYSVLTY
jgi:hypothetical protein